MDIFFKNVSKLYGSIAALKDISFNVASGEFIFIAGPSGSGKSTLLKLILGQIIPTNGEIIIGTTHIAKNKKVKFDNIRKQIGVIFQDYQLISDKTVEENIALSLDIISYPKEKITSKIDEVIKKVKLQNRRFLFPSQLSGGELQRAALARALAIEPKIILADEPTGNLDAENSWNLIKLLKNINEDTRCTILMTTHNLDFIDSLDKRIIYLHHGLIVKGPTECHR